MPVNFAASQVVTAPSPATSGTTLEVVPGDGANFPSTPFNAVIADSSQVLRALDPASEIVRVTSIATDTLTIVRAQESTSARTIVVGDRVYAGVLEAVTARYLPDLGASCVVPGGPCGFADYGNVGGVTNTWYALRLLLLSAATITGIRYMVGGGSGGTVRSALYNSTGGTRLATRTTAVAMGGTGSFQAVPFDSSYAADPGIYFGLIWFSSASATYWGNSYLTTTATGTQSGATPTTISPTQSDLIIPMLGTY